MRCETCQGGGIMGLDRAPLPCWTCGGSGVSHCCDGIQEQAPPSPPDAPCLGPIDEETRRRIDEYNQEQRDPGDETEWPDELGQMEREVTGIDAGIERHWPDASPLLQACLAEHYAHVEPMGCADDCCHPSHGHARIRFAPHDYLIPQAVIDGVTGDLPAAEALVSEMKAGRYRIKSDTHDEWRKLNNKDDNA